MRTRTLLLLVLVAACLPLRARDVDERQTIRKTFPLPSGGTLTVDNVTGSIRVTGYAGREVRATIEERLQADSAEQAAAARREVKLEMTQQGNSVRFYVDGPFRCHDGCGHENGRRGYQVRYDFVIETPADARLELKTVNGGEIQVADTAGDYDLRNVNGRVELRDVAGSGSAATVNGGVTASYRRNPRGACSFKTVNGAVEASFQPGLAADLRFKTLNGGVYTDFETTYLPRVSGVAERRGGRFVYRSDRWFAVRAAAGGPEHSFETLNGDIRVLKRGQSQ